MVVVICVQSCSCCCRGWVPRELGSSGSWLFPSMSPFLRSDLTVSPEVPSAGRVGIMAGFRGFVSNGVVRLGAG